MLKLSGPNDVLWKVLRSQPAAWGLAVPDAHRKTNRNQHLTHSILVFSILKYLCLEVNNKVNDTFVRQFLTLPMFIYSSRKILIEMYPPVQLARLAGQDTRKNPLSSLLNA